MQPLNPEQIEDIKETFKLFDTDGSGNIDATELKVAIRSLGMDQNNQGLKNMIDMITGQGGHSIEFGEFLNMMNSQIEANKHDDSHLMDMFRTLDSNQTGKITFDNLKKVATEIGEKMSDEQLQEMLDEADRDGDGAISAEEFCQILKEDESY